MAIALLVKALSVFILAQLRYFLPSIWSNLWLSLFPISLPRLGHLPNYFGASRPCHAGDHDSHSQSDADEDETQTSLVIHGTGNIHTDITFPTRL